jgi:GNAT superfamily N-acetyltransferase
VNDPVPVVDDPVPAVDDRVPAVDDGHTLRIRPATPADATELLRLRVVLLESLGRDAGPQSAPWRQDALQWFAERATSPRWRIQVAADDQCGQLLAYGAATMAEHLPGPARPTGLKAYIASMVTDPRARGRGLARQVLDELLVWSAQQGADVAGLNATAAGHQLYRSAGFEDSPFTAMTRQIDQ